MASFGSQFVQDPAVVWITRHEYDHLIRISHQYSNLCQNLIGGGVTEEIIETLSNELSSRHHGDLSVQPCTSPASEDIPAPAAYPLSTDEEAGSRSHASVSQDDWLELPSEDSRVPRKISRKVAATEDGSRCMTGGPAGGIAHLHVERVAARSIQFSNLSQDTTHADITAAVRGGALLDVYLRRRDGAASVAFVHGDDAQAFYDHARRNGLFIREKRVKVKWSDRLYTLPGHLAQKLEGGASRNLVIRRCDASHTETSIREDLEHIHNLIVVKLLFLAGDCYISTNSVAHAMFARTCMMSRQKYKGSRIEWDDDECAIPLEYAPPFQHRQSGPSPPLRQSATGSMENRFKLLDLDD